MTVHIVAMGVSGSGKTTVAAMLATRLGYTFGEADTFHPQANVDKMAAGHPLTDDDRWPWLADLAEWMRSRAAAGQSTVLACSALKRSYREVLNSGVEGGCLYLHLHGEASLIAQRMAARSHFMPPELLQSQLATLEPLGPHERGVQLDLGRTPEELTEAGIAWIFSPDGGGVTRR
ncbi:gluconokinase [Enemella sp. A6]|uniref:gluconokinase n=1 Tax=Enemella sp. A6 TaxID=3440152 RepID=UPI003EBB5D36